MIYMMIDYSSVYWLHMRYYMIDFGYSVVSGGKQVKKTAEQVKYAHIFFAVLKGATL